MKSISIKNNEFWSINISKSRLNWFHLASLKIYNNMIFFLEIKKSLFTFFSNDVLNFETLVGGYLKPTLELKNRIPLL